MTVKFHTVTIREFEVIPGLNPSAMGGTPLEIGWRYMQDRELSFEPYESSRAGKRRLASEMRMPPEARFERLLEHGFSAKEINAFKRESQKGRMERAETVESIKRGSFKAQEKNERIKKGVLNLLGSTRKKEFEEIMKRMDDLYIMENNGNGILKLKGILKRRGTMDTVASEECEKIQKHIEIK